VPVALAVVDAASESAPTMDTSTWWRSRIIGGVAGSSLIALGAMGLGFLPYDVWLRDIDAIAALRAQPGGEGLSIACVVVGITALCGNWLLVGRDLRRGSAYLTGDLVRMFWLWVTPLMLAPPLFSRDAWSYAAQGNLLREGLNPYATGPSAVPGPFLNAVDPMWADTPTPYGPLFVVLSGGVVSLASHSVFASVLGMRLLAVVGVVLLARYIPRLARACGVDPVIATWLGLLNPLVVTHLIGDGHNDALMLGLAVAGLALAAERSPALGAAVATLGVGVKAPAAVAVAFVGVMWAGQLSGPRARLRGLALAGLVAAVTFGALTLVSGLGFGWVAALDTPGTVRTWLSPPTATGMAAGAVGSWLGLGTHTDLLITIARLAGGVTAAGVTALHVLRSGSAHPAQPARTAALFLVVAMGSVVQPWYLLWGGVLLAAVARSSRERGLLVWGSVGVAAFSVFSRLPEAGWFVGPLALVGLAWARTIPQPSSRLRQRKVRAATRRPATHQIASTSAMRPYSQEPAGSWEA